MQTENQTRTHYDLPTAVTFLLAGIALGAILTLLSSPISTARGTKMPSGWSREEEAEAAVFE